MSRSISTALKGHLLSGTLTVATCIRIVRTDGVKLGFNTSDKTFDYSLITVPDAYGSISYNNLGGVDPASLRTTSETSVDNIDLTGIITSDRVTEADLLAGRYDDADVTVFIVNYEDLTMGEMIEFRGFIGELTKEDDIWRAELLSQRAKLKRTSVEKTSATCRVDKFGDNRCKYNVASVTFARALTVVTDALHLKFADTAPDDYYQYGWLKSTSGLNNGIEREVKIHKNISGIADITLKEIFPFALVPGDTVLATMGCDHSFAKCKALGNANNFRGEPYLPGNDVYIKVGR